MNKSWINRLAAALTSAIVAACGGGGASGGGATSTSNEIAGGTITGFGSVIVDGKTYADAGAKVSFESDPTAPASAALGDLRLGMKVEVKASGDAASSIVISSQVVGRIEALSSDGFSVAGQAVRVVADGETPTFYEGVSGIADLAAGDFVEVHGARDEAGAIVATRVERRDPRGPFFVRIVGTVAGLNTGTASFTVGGLRVSYDSTTRIVPSSAALADGVGVAVWSDAAPAAGTLQAKAIKVRRAPTVSGDGVRVGGPVRSLDFAAKTFIVDGIPVDAAGAAYVNGTASDLANGRRVRVAGTWADDRIAASEVRFARSQGDDAVNLAGAITDFLGAASFKVRGVPVDASADTVSFVGGDASQLADGVLVRVQGRVEGDVVKAGTVSFPSTADGVARSLIGIVASYDATSGEFRLGNLAMRLADDARLRYADGSAANRAEFGNGDRVLVRGAFSAGSFTAGEVVFVTGPTAVVNRIDGKVTEVDIAAGVFRLNRTLVRAGDTVSWTGDRQNLRSGVHVHVEGTIVGGELIARVVEITAPDEASRVRGVGTVSDFVSLADFHVAGQRVDASSANFAGGVGGDLGDGDFVEIRGPVVDGVVKASLVVFR